MRAEDTAPCARVAIVIGKATNEKGELVRTGQILNAGAKLITGDSSLIKIILSDDSVVDVGSSSRFKISACAGKGWVTKINLELEKGKIRANVNKAPKISREEFKLKTPTSILAVRGTEFFVSWQQNSAGGVAERIGVSEGQVEVKSLFDRVGSPILVATGTEFQAMGKVQAIAGQLKVEASAPPKVDQFTAQEQRQFEQNTKVENNTFDQNVEIQPGKNQDSEANNGQKKKDQFLATATKGELSPGREPTQASENGPKEGPRHGRGMGPGSAGLHPSLDAPGNGQINQPGFPNLVPMTFVWGVTPQ